MQCRTNGVIAERTWKRLGVLATGARASLASAGALRPGTCLMREWKGRTYRVEVVEGGGFLMDGKTYRSLSAIAKRITGAHWSGPRFFGIG